MKSTDDLGKVMEQVQRAETVTSDLMLTLINEACVDLPVQSNGRSDLARLNQLIESSAWIELELPGWKLRRLVYEDGTWRCALSKGTRPPRRSTRQRPPITKSCLLPFCAPSRKRVCAPALRND